MTKESGLLDLKNQATAYKGNFYTCEPASGLLRNFSFWAFITATVRFRFYLTHLITPAFCYQPNTGTSGRFYPVTFHTYTLNYAI